MSRVTAHVYAIQHSLFVLYSDCLSTLRSTIQYCTIGFLHPHFKNTHQDFSTPIRLAERKLVWQHSFGENQQHWSHTDLICTYCQSGKLGDGGRKQTVLTVYWLILLNRNLALRVNHVIISTHVVCFCCYFAHKLAVQSAQNCLLSVRSNTSWIGYLTQPARQPIPRPTQTYDRLYASIPSSPPISHHVTPACVTPQLPASLHQPGCPMIRHDLIFQELVPGYNTAARDQMIRITCATMAGGPACSGSIRRVARKPGNLVGRRG